MILLSEIKEVLRDCQQEHLLDFWDELNSEEQVTFLKQLDAIDFHYANKIYQRSQNSEKKEIKDLDSQMKPVPTDQFESVNGINPQVLEEYRIKGLEEISKNHVAVLLLAGGQGTRLGVSYPKGMFPIELPSEKCLYQIQAERILRLMEIAANETGKNGRITWYIMTSQATYSTTCDYLSKHQFFGLNKDDVIFFNQGLLPAFSFEGKMFLEEKNSVALAPDGNGGLYLALKKNKVIEHMMQRGIKYVHTYCVDNILVKVADPIFIGYCVKKGADCGAKVVKKEKPNEAVGVVCQVNGKFQVVEYSEITEETATLKDSDGNLQYRAGNICNHFFSTAFLKEVSEEYEQYLKLHVAKKKIPFINKDGKKVKPTTPNGIKLEKFIFDVFEFCENFVTWEVPRYSEFSPLKNCESVSQDCPSTVRRDLLNLHKMYIEKTGGKVLEGVDVEISPLVSYAGENLEKYVRGKVFDKTTVINPQE